MKKGFFNELTENLSKLLVPAGQKLQSINSVMAIAQAM